MSDHEREHAILFLASRQQLPDPIDRSSEVDLALVAELLDANLLKGSDISTFDGPAFANVRITHSGRERLHTLEAMKHVESFRPQNVAADAIDSLSPTTGASMANVRARSKNHVRIFISHSATDHALAKALVTLLRDALGISSKEIRCTSVDGYRLQPGTVFSSQLRDEVMACDVFVALLSTASLHSPFVTFEMGARWGSTRPLLLLLAQDVTSTHLTPPLSEIHAISVTNEGDLHALVHSIADSLGVDSETPNVYINSLKALMQIRPDKAQRRTSATTQIAYATLSEDQLRVLWEMGRMLARVDAEYATPAQLSQLCAINALRTKAAIHALHSYEILGMLIEPGGDKVYLLPKGLEMASDLYTLDEQRFDCARDHWNARHGMLR